MSLPTIPCTLELDADGDGFVALVDAPAYRGFIGDWELESLFELFDQRSRDGVLALQYVEQEHAWVRLDVVSEASDRPARREVTLPLTITGEQLWGTTYTDLTMVAQFEDSKLIDQASTEPVLALDNGQYVLTFRWLDAETTDDEPDQVELVIVPGTCEAPARFPGADILLG